MVCIIIELMVVYNPLQPLLCVGVDKWFPLTPIHKDDEVQGEVLIEINIEQFGDVSMHVVRTVFSGI